MIYLSDKSCCFLRKDSGRIETCLVLNREVSRCNTTLSIPYYIIRHWKGYIRAVTRRLYLETNYHRCVLSPTFHGRKRVLVNLYLYNVTESKSRVIIKVIWKPYFGEITLNISEFNWLSKEMFDITRIMRDMEYARMSHFPTSDDEGVIM